MTSNTKNTSSRIGYLDGLRGFGAVQVMFLHIVSILFPFVFAQDVAKDTFQTAIKIFPIQFFYAGDLAVFIFFLISGYVLSQAYRFETKPLISIITSRYSRLALPCFASGILTLFLASIFGNFVGYGNYNKLFDIMSTLHFVKDMFFNTMLISYGDSSAFYFIPFLNNLVPPTRTATNPVLWTIGIEMLGSIIIIILCRFEQKKGKKFSTLLAILFGIFLFKSFYILFILGYLMNRYRFPIAKSARDMIYMVSLIAIGLCLSMATFSQQHAFSFVDKIAATHFGLPPQSGVSFQLMIAAILIFIGVLRLNFLQEILQNRFFQFLGHYSFPIYLVHYPILRYVGLYISRFGSSDAQNTALYSSMASIICIMLSFIVASYFVHIDKLSIQLSRWIDRKFHF